jgi:predicted nucleic acid-binding protein
LDTGPLVAAINRRDRVHRWAIAAWKQVAKPLLTCEAVPTEACFLLQNTYGGSDAVMVLLSNGVLQLPFQISEEVAAVRNLMRRYQSVPMSLADACMVRMAELYANSPVLTPVLTIDSDFQIYRINRNQTIPLIIPDDAQK